MGTSLELCGSASNLQVRGCVLEVLPFFSVAANPYSQVRFAAGALICEDACVHMCVCGGAHVCILLLLLLLQCENLGICSSLFIPGGEMPHYNHYNVLHVLGNLRAWFTNI